MKFKKTALFALFVLIFAAVVYWIEVKKEDDTEQKKIVDTQILKFDQNQINLIEIEKKDEKIALQKNEKGWSLVEPIQDQADNDQIEEFLKSIAQERTLTIAKEATQLTPSDLNEFGLDSPAVIYRFKNNLGQSRKITVGSQKNFEGNAFVLLDNENQVHVANASWLTRANEKVIFYREKKLYRLPLANVNQVKITTLQDRFDLKMVDGQWKANPVDYILDQNKVREIIKKISEAGIQEYVFEGEPGKNLIKEKGLVKAPVHIEFLTNDNSWAVDVNQSEKENTLYALTDRPTRLLKLDKTIWEFLGNLNLDSLRDRVSITRFNLDEVKSLYFKSADKILKFYKKKDQWQFDGSLNSTQSFNSAQFVRLLNRLHDLEISEFIDKKKVDQFKGDRMLILKSDSDHLVYQLNWGPEFKMKKNGIEKEYYYARTQISSSIFAVEKNKLDSLNFEATLLKEDSIKNTESSPTRKNMKSESNNE